MPTMQQTDIHQEVTDRFAPPADQAHTAQMEADIATLTRAARWTGSEAENARDRAKP